MSVSDKRLPDFVTLKEWTLEIVQGLRPDGQHPGRPCLIRTEKLERPLILAPVGRTDSCRKDR
jgi:hypothetical protein